GGAELSLPGTTQALAGTRSVDHPVDLGGHVARTGDQRGNQEVVETTEVVSGGCCRNGCFGCHAAVRDSCDALAFDDSERGRDDFVASLFALGLSAVAVGCGQDLAPPSSSRTTPPTTNTRPAIMVGFIPSPRNAAPMRATRATPAAAQIA